LYFFCVLLRELGKMFVLIRAFVIFLEQACIAAA
jgi:hypothetical protein